MGFKYHVLRKLESKVAKCVRILLFFMCSTCFIHSSDDPKNKDDQDKHEIFEDFEPDKKVSIVKRCFGSCKCRYERISMDCLKCFYRCLMRQIKH